MDFLPKDIFSLIVPKLDRHMILILPRISRIFYNFRDSYEYKQMLTTEIRKSFDFSLDKYNIKELERLYLMGRRKYLYLCEDYSYILNERG